MWKYECDRKHLRLHRFSYWLESIPQLFIAELLGSFRQFPGFVILKNWVNLRNQDLNRICERKRGKASILEGLQLCGRWHSERRARNTAVIRKPDYVHLIGRRLVSVVYAAPVSVSWGLTCSHPFASLWLHNCWWAGQKSHIKQLHLVDFKWVTLGMML